MTLSDFGKDAKQVLATVAPLIGTALGGPFGGLAGTVLSKWLGTSDPKEMEAAITSTDPDILLKLQQANADMQERMKQLQIDEEKLVYDDVANARAREMAVKDSTPRQLAWLMIGGFMVMSAALIAALFIWPDKADTLLKGQAGLLLGTIYGYLANEAKQCASYYFGTSAGSLAKDVTIADIAKKP